MHIRFMAVRCLGSVLTAALLSCAAEDAPVSNTMETSAVSANWQKQVVSALEQQEYFVSLQKDGLQAPNRAQNLRTYFREGGIDVVPRQSEEEAALWQFAWRTSGWGRAGQIATLSAANAAPHVNGARVSYAHDGLDEWYENKKEGIEQGFTVHDRPAGVGPLIISGQIDGGLRPTLSATEDAVDLVDEHGARALRYGELHVWDARGRELPSHLAVDGLEVAICIDDDAANYPLTIDPLLTSPSWTAESNLPSALLGFSVATAGDVNGDGFSDVIVGAWGYSGARGQALVYHGSASGPSLTPNWTVDGDQATALLGYSVAAAGDVNGDGFDDVIVGERDYDNPSTSEGRAHVYHGSASGLNLTPNWTAESDQAISNFGVSVATAGDVNGDGFADVIVGCPNFDNGQDGEGRAFVYYGSASGLSPSANWIGEGNLAGVQFGNSVSTAGDVNADGFDDVIVGAWLYTNGQGSEGRAFVYHGSASGLSTTSQWSAEANQGNAYFGSSVAGAGDVNGDGFADVIIGAPGYTNGQSTEGRAYVYHGSATGLNLLAWTAESNQADNSFGLSVATAGDVNGDGFADVVVGNKDWTNGQFTEGRADVYQGSAAGLMSTSSWTAEGNQASAQFGISAATAGDVNGDGYSDLIVGAYQYDNGQADEGGAFVYRGAAAGLSTTAAWTAESNKPGAQFGYSVATAGDVNGDGFSDVIVAAPTYDNGENDEGVAFVYHGSVTGLSTTYAWTAESNQANASFGTSVATAGDVNGDGFSDVVVGAYGYDNGESAEGRAFVYHGSAAGLSTTYAWTAESNQAFAFFGFSVASAGDVNGDGFSDVVVGAHGYDNDEFAEGRAFVYHGSTSGLGATADWTAEPNQAGANFGRSVATAGDVNGDGFSGVIVGAIGYDNGETDEGRAFVYDGSGTGLSTTAAWTAESNQANANFGGSVATAGDINGDGYSDVIVGAASYGPTDEEGRAFAYLGSAAGLSTMAAWTAEPAPGTEAFFGTSVASAGDVNGDGFSDVIVGADSYDNGENNEGSAFVYHGSDAGLLTTVAWSGESNQDEGRFGNSVATAGDVNGDGYSDVIVGANGYDNGESLEGRAFVYYGNGGDGLDRIPRQMRADGAAPIEVLGRSDSPSGFGLEALGRTSAGRGRVRLQYEVKTFGTPFNGTGLTTGPVFDTGLPVLGIGSAVALSELASGLNGGTLYHWRLRILADSPFFPRSPWLTIPGNAMTEADLRTAASVTDVAELSPSASWLRPCAPNPFTATTKLSFALPMRGRVRLAIYDLSGRKVATLSDEFQEAGAYALSWDGRDAGGRRVAAGVYFARLTLGDRVEAQKVLLSR